MMKNKYIQPVSECDLNDILELQKKAFKEVAKVMDNYDIPPLQQTIDELKLEFNTNVILKYTNDKNQIVGSIRAYLDELNICHVGKLIVSPDCQNHGIGRRLMFEIESYFHQCKKFTLFTGKETPNTLHLYQTVGYEIVEKKMINSIAMYIMEKQPKQQYKGMEEKQDEYVVLRRDKRFTQILIEMVTINSDRTDMLIDALTTLWEASVRATHHFLSEDDIQKLTPFVKMGLSCIETVVVASDNHKPIAFMGIEAGKIEMLFVFPQHFGKGIGRQLAELGISQYEVQYVDVNEQNTQAIGFYRHIGFEVFKRTELDEQGNTFPILKMKRGLFFIRQATTNDIASILDLYRNTVLTVNRRDYSQAEVEDWASCGSAPKSEEMIKTHYFIVAETFQSQIVGFSSITPQGYLHSMFVHKDFQGKGVASTLLNEIERYAKEKEITKITSEVSLTARPFFEKRGYAVETEQKRQANKLSLTNFWMMRDFTRMKSDD